MTPNPNTPPIPKHMRGRFNTLLRAAERNDLALMSCLDAETREPRFVICAVNVDEAGGETSYTFVPLAHLTPQDDPYDAYIPPA